MNFDVQFMMTALQAGLGAAPLTARIALAAFGISLFFGTAIAIIRVYRVPILADFLKFSITVFKAVPGILMLYIIYFSFVAVFNGIAGFLKSAMSSKDISVNVIAVAALSFTGSVTVSETIRGSFLSVDRGQYEGAYSVGLSVWQTLRRIILPQVIPAAVPVLCNNLIFFVKSSSILFYISVMDILNAAMIPATANYRFLEAYIAAALIYWGICIIIERVSKILERYFNRYRRIAL
jgi:L-cystine transport system permease protein